MSAKAWKALQRFSYLMVALLAVHVGFVLGASAFSGRVALATVSFVAYVVVVLAYAALRIRKAHRDARRRAERGEATAPAAI